MNKPRTFTVTVYVPDTVSNTELREFIRTAIKCEGGNYEKDHPLFPAHWEPSRTRVKPHKS